MSPRRIMTSHPTKCFVAALTYDGYKRASVGGGVYTTMTQTSPQGEAQAINCGVSAVSGAGFRHHDHGNQTVAWQVPPFPRLSPTPGLSTRPAGRRRGGTGGHHHHQCLCADRRRNRHADGQRRGHGRRPDLGPRLYRQLHHRLRRPDLAGDQSAGCDRHRLLPSLDNATPTGDNNGNVVEIDAALKSFYDNYKVSPTKMWVGSQQAADITKKVLAGGTRRCTPSTSTAAPNGGSRRALSAARSFRSTTTSSRWAGRRPFRSRSTRIFPVAKSSSIATNPYPLANIPGPYRMHLLRDYWQRLWPQMTETRYTSVNFYGVLQLYVPFAMGLIDNIAAG